MRSRFFCELSSESSSCHGSFIHIDLAAVFTFLWIKVQKFKPSKVSEWRWVFCSASIEIKSFFAAGEAINCRWHVVWKVLHNNRIWSTLFRKTLMLTPYSFNSIQLLCNVGYLSRKTHHHKLMSPSWLSLFKPIWRLYHFQTPENTFSNNKFIFMGF